MGRLALGNSAAGKQHSRNPNGIVAAGSRPRYGACGRISCSHWRARVRSGGAMMKHVLPFLITIADRKSTRLNSSHRTISYAVFCLKKKNTIKNINNLERLRED